MTGKHKVALAFDGQMREDISDPVVMERLGAQFDWSYSHFDLYSDWTVSPAADPDAAHRLAAESTGAEALIVSHGSPLVDDYLLDLMPGVGFVGELEGDRFASRIDVAACNRRGIRVIDTNNFCSPTVAEWSLALILMGLKNYGMLMRQLLQERRTGTPARWMESTGYSRGELTGRTVGLIGFGHIGRHLRALLRPFNVTVLVHDPYVPLELADVMDVTFTSLENVLAAPDIVVCLVPLTPATERMLGVRELGMMRPGTVFVNVSRGKIVDSEALTELVQRGQIIACLDTTDPEPLPADSPLIDEPGAILSPHVAGLVSVGRARSLSLMLDELELHFAGHEPRFQLLPRTIANRAAQPDLRETARTPQGKVLAVSSPNESGESP
jgi:phosphoglycerate dehydrogenase-like enzyme